jgi:hypothetical protein
MNRIPKLIFFFLILIFFFSYCSFFKNNNNPSNLNKKNASNNCSAISPITSMNFKTDFNLIKKQSLLPHLLRQQIILKEFSTYSENSLNPDGEYLIGRFDSGIIELNIIRIDGEPTYIYGLVDEFDNELEFLIYGIDSDEIENLIIGNKYKIHWIETICLMEPYDHGYQRIYLAYKIE